jgi:hypothetical protein
VPRSFGISFCCTLPSSVGGSRSSLSAHSGQSGVPSTYISVMAPHREHGSITYYDNARVPPSQNQRSARVNMSQARLNVNPQGGLLAAQFGLR